MTMGRWKNYGLWVSLASLLLMILQLFGVQISTEKYDMVVNAALTFLVAAGVISNPATVSKWFTDDKNDQVK
ncbi:holin [Priestia koreensis]|uniref:Holin n=2 Tax=Priestia koreensis TaxID=284581 RepID=A0A0M0LIM0_9BACI|nr:holin [Priestia koreensis]